MDRKAVESGIESRALMAAAARAIVRVITHRFQPGTVGILCGPGNNGGDGLLVAQKLRRLGWSVDVISDPDHRRRQGDAAWAQSLFGSKEKGLDLDDLGRFDLVIDAGFGAGFSRQLSAEISSWFNKVRQNGTPIVAVDIASGVHGTSGDADPNAPRARLTISFVRPKYGHALLPGRLHAGDVVIADIGIDDAQLAALGPTTCLNAPANWAERLPRKGALSNKYDAGHAVVMGGPTGRIGAATLTALAADSIGAGLVTLACQSGDVAAYQPHVLDVMLKPVDDLQDLEIWLRDRRITALAIGPALGFSDVRERWLEILLGLGKPAVIDADAISMLGAQPKRFLPLLHKDLVLTPHDGEFARIFEASGSRLERARRAAAALGSVIVLKGGDSVVASPCGRAAIATHAPPDLAKAGSGDVLCGTIAGLMAQGMPAFDAACAGVWIHGQAGRLKSRLTASELIAKGMLATALTQAAATLLLRPENRP